MRKNNHEGWRRRLGAIVASDEANEDPQNELRNLAWLLAAGVTLSIVSVAILQLGGYPAVAGICAGIADYSGLDVTLVRLIVAVVSVITGGTGVLAYLAAWMIIPGEGENASIAQDILGKKQNA